MKHRLSQHSGRGYNDRHNDRNFDIKKAEHINVDKTVNNTYYTWVDFMDGDSKKELLEEYESMGINNLSFKDWEMEFYNYHYSDALEKTNANYIKQRHPERCKTMQDWLESKEKGPEEIILQIGNVNSNISDDVFKECAMEYIDALQEWNEATGKHMQILDIAIHVDEASPHMHIRRVWEYDEDGISKIGQDKGLEQAGVEIPNPSKKKSRTNNRKMTFDKMMREKWIEIVKSRGFDLELTPLPNRTHAKKPDYIRTQEQLMQDREKQVEEQRKSNLEAKIEIDKEREELNKEREAFKDDLRAFSNQKEQFLAERLKIQNKASEALSEAKKTLTEVGLFQTNVIKDTVALQKLLPADTKPLIKQRFEKVKENKAATKLLFDKVDDMLETTNNEEQKDF